MRDQYDYFQWYIKKFGQDSFDSLRKRYRQTVKWNTKHLEEMYESYRTDSGEGWKARIRTS